MNNNRECADYFRRKREYDRCFLEMRKKWESYGKASGRIVLADATEEEKRALGGILGESFYDGEIRFIAFVKYQWVLIGSYCIFTLLFVVHGLLFMFVYYVNQ